MPIDKYFGNTRSFPVSTRGFSFSGTAALEIRGKFPVVVFESWNGQRYEKFFDEATDRTEDDFIGVTLSIQKGLVVMVLSGTRQYSSLRRERIDRLLKIFEFPEEDDKQEAFA